MKGRGTIKKVFPGSNSAYGFYSYYDQIMGPEAARIFILKGGPGVGKSTFMGKIAGEMLAHGYDVEYHYCSSNPESIDAVAFHSIGVALIDGTKPHLIDPKYPGAIDEIINLGGFWDESKIIGQKTPIVKITQEIGRTFGNVYKLLQAADLYLKALEDYYNLDDYLDKKARDRLLLELIENTLEGKSRRNEAGRVRRLFASAITPLGTVNHLESLAGNLAHTYVLNGENGRVKEMITRGIADAAVRRGFLVEAFCCALDPHIIDHLLIPELNIGIINSREPHLFVATGKSTHIDTGEITCRLPGGLEAEKDDFRRRYQDALQGGLHYLRKAKALHDELESYYIPQMRFDEVDRLVEQTLERILDWPGKSN
jgi:hypothetical protein